MSLWLHAVFNYVLDLKLSNEMETFVIEKQKQQEQLQALELSISFKQEATEQQLALYQQRVELLEKLLDQLREGKALGILCNTHFEWGQQKQKLMERWSSSTYNYI